MAVSYDSELTTDRDRVRFYLQDTADGDGPKPADANFSDAELDGLITLEGSWQKAVAAGFETLAAAWRKYPDYKADDVSISSSDIADGYAEDAKEWRSRYMAAPTSLAGSRPVTRQDGYSDDKDNVTD